jgi:hypothetical protein
MLQRKIRKTTIFFFCFHLVYQIGEITIQSSKLELVFN